jgi:hypothetical protein
MNASGYSDVCVCVMAKPPGLRRRGVQRVTLGHAVGPARAGHLGVGGLLPEGDALPEDGGAPRRGVLSSEVDCLSRPVRGRFATLRPSRRCRRAYAGGARVNFLVPVHQGRDLLHHQRTPASSGAARALRICKTLYLYCVRRDSIYCIASVGIFVIHCGRRFFMPCVADRLEPSIIYFFPPLFADGGFLRHRVLIKIGY